MYSSVDALHRGIHYTRAISRLLELRLQHALQSSVIIDFYYELDISRRIFFQLQDGRKRQEFYEEKLTIMILYRTPSLHVH